MVVFHAHHGNRQSLLEMGFLLFSLKPHSMCADTDTHTYSPNGNRNCCISDPLIVDAKWFGECNEMALIILFTHNLCTRETVHLFSLFSHYASGAAPGTKLKKPFIMVCNCFCSTSDSNSSLVWCSENKTPPPPLPNSDFNLPKYYRLTLRWWKITWK